jgi:hypothetical protein
MSADRNTSGAEGPLFSVYFKFVNSAKKAAGAIRYVRCSSWVLANNEQSITSFSCVSQRAPHSGAYGVLHSEHLSRLCGFSEELCSDTLW